MCQSENSPEAARRAPGPSAALALSHLKSRSFHQTCGNCTCREEEVEEVEEVKEEVVKEEVVVVKEEEVVVKEALGW